MKNWSAKSSPGGVIGIVLTVLTLVALAGVLWLTVTASLQTYEDGSSAGTNLGTFGLGLLACGLLFGAGLLAYRTWRFFQLRYYLDRNALKIELGGKQRIIPLANIRYMVAADKLLDQLRQTAYGQDAPPEPQRRSDGVKVQTYSQPRTQTAIAHKLETVSTATAADSSLDEAEIIEGNVVEVEDEPSESPVADNEMSETLVIPEPDTAKEEQEPAAATETTSQNDKKEATVPQYVAFKVKTRPLTAWPGFYTNQGWLASLGEVQFYSSRPFAECLLVRTGDTTYAISPTDYAQFTTEYKLRRNLGAIEQVEEETVRGRFLSHPLRKDWLGRGLIAAGVLLNLALFTFLFLRFPELPPTMRLHYNKYGVVDRLESASAILWLPYIGLATAVVNSLLGALLQPRERVPALLLYGSIIAVQLMVWIAAIGIIVSSGN